MIANFEGELHCGATTTPTNRLCYYGAMCRQSLHPHACAQNLKCMHAYIDSVL